MAGTLYPQSSQTARCTSERRDFPSTFRVHRDDGRSNTYQSSTIRRCDGAERSPSQKELPFVLRVRECRQQSSLRVLHPLRLRRNYYLYSCVAYGPEFRFKEILEK